MKTSVIHVHDMLSVLSVDEVEKRIGEVPGVESVTLNFAAGSATVRYDETRLEVHDIKSAVRQRSYESEVPVVPAGKPAEDKAEVTATQLLVKPPEEKDNTESKPPAKVEKPDMPTTTTPAVKPTEEKDKTETKPPEKAEDHAGHKDEEMSEDKAAMAQEMGHGTGASMEKMVHAMRNRFFVTLFFIVFIFLYAPVFAKLTGFKMPLPFGIAKELMEFILATPIVLYGGWVFYVGAY
jgi:Cu2+-exporting ATPase